jgi:hypothetical protein
MAKLLLLLLGGRNSWSARVHDRLRMRGMTVDVIPCSGVALIRGGGQVDHALRHAHGAQIRHSGLLLSLMSSFNCSRLSLSVSLSSCRRTRMALLRTEGVLLMRRH